MEGEDSRIVSMKYNVENKDSCYFRPACTGGNFFFTKFANKPSKVLKKVSTGLVVIPTFIQEKTICTFGHCLPNKEMLIL